MLSMLCSKRNGEAEDEVCARYIYRPEALLKFIRTKPTTSGLRETELESEVSCYGTLNKNQSVYSLLQQKINFKDSITPSLFLSKWIALDPHNQKEVMSMVPSVIIIDNGPAWTIEF